MATVTPSASRAPLHDLWLATGVVPLGQVLLRSAERDPGHEALVFPDLRVTYGDLADRAWTIARSLVGLGVRRGEHVGLLMTNHVDLVAAFFGAALAGAIVVPINARYRQAELDYLIRDADLVAVLTHDYADDHVDFTALLHESLPGLADAPDPRRLQLPEHPVLRQVVMLGSRTAPGLVDRETFAALGEQADARDLRTRVEGAQLREVALILYTSGTTAAPRGAMLTHEAFVRGWMTTGGIWRTTREDRHWSALPLYHVTALGCLTWVLSYGATFVTDYIVEPGRALDALERERCTQAYPAYPPITEAILNHPTFAERDLSALRAWLNVAPPEVLAKFQARLPHAVQLTTYGGTEGGCVSTQSLDDPLEARLATCGGPLPGMELRICDERGEVVPAGTPGDIQFRGYSAFSGYYKHPEKTAETLLEDGWVRLGDLGVMDEDGRVLFLGRTKETLKVGGENVAPQEIEGLLCAHPAVKLAAVVGMPDQRLLEVPAAYVELVPGADASADELIEHVRGKLASFKVPRLVRFIDAEEWPMSLTKIKRVALRERLLDELGGTSGSPAASEAAPPASAASSAADGGAPPRP